MPRRATQKSFRTFVKEDLFGGWFATSTTIFAFVGYLGFVTGLTTQARRVSESWPGHIEFAIYIWVTWLATAVMFAVTLVVVRTVREKVIEARELNDLMAVAHHKLAEVVRRHAVETESRGLDDDSALRDVFSSKILRYLELRLGRSDISVTVKYAGAGNGLKAKFRHPMVEGKSTNRTPEITVDESVVFVQFRANDRRMQRVVIRDVTLLDTTEKAGADADRNHRYKGYAERCGFRSVLAFPLREPESLGTGTTTKMKISNILGFLSFDSPDPQAFDGLFKKQSRKQRKTPDNFGEMLESTSEIDFFYGIADTLATLAVLSERAASRQPTPTPTRPEENNGR